MHTVTGYGLCKDHQKMYDDGFVALIEVENEPDGDTLHQSEAYRTGKIAHIKKEYLKVDQDTPVMFVQKGVLDELAKKTAK